MTKVILISGGCGFMGVNLIKNIVLNNYASEIIVLDNFITSDPDQFDTFKSKLNSEIKITLFDFDITNPKMIPFIKERYGIINEIYHLASLASPIAYKRYPLKTLDTGYIGTRSMLELAYHYNSKLLLASTSEVYGDPDISPQTESYYGNVNSFGARSCYSDDTEILTENGYKLFSDLNYNDKVATLNSNKQLEYHIPDEIIKEKYVGDMYEFKNWNIELNVTPNHKMYVKKRNYNEFELLPAESKFSWDRAVLKKTCNYTGKKQEWFYFPENLRELKNQKTPFVEKVNMDLWLEFMGYYLSEGSTRISTQNKRNKVNGKIYECGIFKVQISQSETVKPLYFEKIKQCLDKMPFHYNISRAGNSYFVISNKQLAHYLIRFGKSKDKFIPSDLLSLTKPQLVILLDALMLGDGTIDKNTNSKTYFSSSYKLMSGIQELLLKIGSFGNILKENRKDEDKKENQMYYMTINSNPDKNYTYSKPIINNYNGYVYCVNVKTHIIFVRRNGKAVFCGNCYDESKRVAEALCYTYINKYNVDIKIARIFNTYGPYMYMNDGRIITEIIRHLICDTELTIFGDGTQTRSICYVDNTVDMLIRLMESNCNIPVNIGYNKEMSVNDIVNITKSCYHKLIKNNEKYKNLKFNDLKIRYIELTQDDPLIRQPCLKLNQEILGKTDYISMEQGITNTIQFFLDN